MISIIIPGSVLSIGNSAFFGCFELTSIFFRGNAPMIGSSAFFGANNSTVYYLYGATGWSSTFAGRPTALWKPLVQTTDDSFGVQSNQFGFTITWASGQVMLVEACTNLANPVWLPLQTNALTHDACFFSDPDWTNHPVRFYRVHSPL